MAGSSNYTWRHALQLHSTLSPFDSPVPGTHKAFADMKAKPVSWVRKNIAGMLVTIYGLQELASDTTQFTCFWLLHGRGDTQDSMGYCAAAMLHAWKSKRQPGQRGLICITFDQRNHGSRLVDDKANVSWKQGNPTHAQDMFNTYSGSAQDVSHLITHIPSYLPAKPTDHICGGVSLGGHATWQVLMAEPRVRAGLVVIGCPDYIRLMSDRAIRSKLRSCTDTDPPGLRFLGSEDFPQNLIEAVEKYDPAGILLGELDVVTGDDHRHPPSDAEKARLRTIMAEKLAGKNILCVHGGKDRLVPYAQSEPFFTWLKKALDAKTGWFNDHGTTLEDFIDPAGMHEFSGVMRVEAERWLCDLLARDDEYVVRGSKL
ncbi:Hypothetical protein R9X50_00463900 [Acrodontium crateriforme]|uniref:AB hydrolase-1 domain-containing protein n=1 Tax=Acrodontium crateriforme TaxID=150365 RepID=A0AAQ3RAB0_9PEZI|nr:Hypothetical protein R9X50_00463900 [Acrodontium crateriforme]